MLIKMFKVVAISELMKENSLEMKNGKNSKLPIFITSVSLFFSLSLSLSKHHRYYNRLPCVLCGPIESNIVGKTKRLAHIIVRSTNVYK